MASADLIPAAPLTVVTVPVPVPVPVDHCIPVPVPLTVERIIEHPVERTVEKTVERMVEKTVEKTVQQLLTVAVPVERTVEIEVPVESVLCKDMPVRKRRMRHIDVGGEEVGVEEASIGAVPVTDGEQGVGRHRQRRVHVQVGELASGDGHRSAEGPYGSGCKDHVDTAACAGSHGAGAV